MRRRLAPLCLSLLLASGAGAVGSARADQPDDDEFLRGYVVSFLEQFFQVGRDRVRVAVEGGVVTLEGSLGSPEEIDRIVAAVGTLRGVERVVNRLEVEGGEPRRWRTWMDWRQPAPGRQTVRFPAGDLFAAPLADQKQPRFHTTWQRWHTGTGTFDIASVGFGENFGLVRWPRGHPGDGWQLGISG